MKKRFIAAAILTLSASAANAQINLDIGIGGGPAYVAEPAPVYVEHPALPEHFNGRDRHRYHADHDRVREDHRDDHHR